MQQLATVESVMTPNPINVDPAATLRDAVTTMHRFDIRHLPVTAGDQLLGIISDRDIRLNLDKNSGTIRETGETGDYLDRVIVEDLMTYNPVTVQPSSPLLEVIDLLLSEKIGALPVVAAGDDSQLVGIISYLDLLAYLREVVVELV